MSWHARQLRPCEFDSICACVYKAVRLQHLSAPHHKEPAATPANWQHSFYFVFYSNPLTPSIIWVTQRQDHLSDRRQGLQESKPEAALHATGSWRPAGGSARWISEMPAPWKMACLVVCSTAQARRGSQRGLAVWPAPAGHSLVVLWSTERCGHGATPGAKRPGRGSAVAARPSGPELPPGQPSRHPPRTGWQLPFGQGQRPNTRS